MKKKKILMVLLCVLILGSLTGCTSSTSSNNWEKDANKANYFKKNGKWYYQGNIKILSINTRGNLNEK